MTIVLLLRQQGSILTITFYVISGLDFNRGTVMEISIKKKVCVLLSTYNGEKFLREQLDSLLAQKNVDVEVVVRDDGSTDNTRSILKEYTDKYSNVIVHEDINIGCERSFWLLLTKYRVEADYYAFCDQDDKWIDYKLACAVAKLENVLSPRLYSCNQVITDDNLNQSGIMLPKSKYRNICKHMHDNYFLNRHACTLVWNLQLQKLIEKSTTTQLTFTPIHDKWVTLVGRSCGEVILDFDSLQYYRLHNSNTSGLAKGLLARIKKGITRYWINKTDYDKYATAIIDLYGDLLHSNDRGLAHLFRVSKYKSSAIEKVRLLFSEQTLKMGFPDAIFWQISILFNRY